MDTTPIYATSEGVLILAFLGGLLIIAITRGIAILRWRIEELEDEIKGIKDLLASQEKAKKEGITTVFPAKPSFIPPHYKKTMRNRVF